MARTKRLNVDDVREFRVARIRRDGRNLAWALGGGVFGLGGMEAGGQANARQGRGHYGPRRLHLNDQFFQRTEMFGEALRMRRELAKTEFAYQSYS